MDTVERLQGGERETIIVSATASDPAAIAARAEFILNLNRANVAFSRAKRRLIVVCAESLLEHIPPEVEHYGAAVLWKSLRSLCTHVVSEVSVGKYRAAITTTWGEKTG
jgi:superfamily I DNA and/or RNA helicase